MKIFNSSKNSNPLYATEDSAGIDLCIKNSVTFRKGVRTLIETGIHVEIPKGNVGLLVLRSSMSKKYLYLTNSVGIIDADYRGELIISLIYNPPTATEEYWSDWITVGCGERIAQLVVMPYYTEQLEYVTSLEDLSSTNRGTGGFGSTGT